MRAVLCTKSAYRVYCAPAYLPILLIHLGDCQKGPSSLYWTQTDRLKTDIAGGPRRWSSSLNSHSFVDIQYCNCRHQFLTQIALVKDDACLSLHNTAARLMSPDYMRWKLAAANVQVV